MTPIQFDHVNRVIAENQPPYLPFPVYSDLEASGEGRITACWKLSLKERLTVLFTGKIWHQILTFNRPLQPQKLLATAPWMTLNYSEER